MYELARLFISIALFRKGPQDVPYSLFLLVMLIAANFSIDLLTHLIVNIPEEVASLPVLFRYLVISNIVFILVNYTIFKLHGHSRRFVQSLTAMSGIDLLISIIFLPILIMLVIASMNKLASIGTLGFLLYMFLIGWNLFINLHIYRFGLSVSMIYAGMLSLAMFALEISLEKLLIPGVST